MNKTTITVQVDIPDGETCYWDDGRCCHNLYGRVDRGQSWCRLFERVVDVGIDEDIAEYRVVNRRKCNRCREALKK